jgi:two-component system CheB/CheR fusion protein
VREELRIELTTALYRALEKGESTQSGLIPLLVNGVMRSVSISVRPATLPELKGFVTVLFEEHDEQHEAPYREPSNEDHNAVVLALEEELDSMRGRLQTTVEEYETSKEEMKAANEELQSMNEELRSTAEELETSKEELQSINEELITVNQENRSKIEELSQLTSDLQNLLAATDIATLFLDRELRIKRFTPRVSELFNILPTDRGRLLAHITHKLGYGSLVEDAGAVLRTLVPAERETSDEDGNWYLMRLLPYRTIDDRIDGVVITFIDLTERKKGEQERERLIGELAGEQQQLQTLTETQEQRIAERTSEARAIASALLAGDQQAQQHVSQLLNDTLQPLLAQAHQQIQSLREQLSGDPPEDAQVQAGQIGDLLERAGQAAQRLGAQLAPVEFHRQNFAEMLQALVDNLRQAYSLEVTLGARGAPALSPPMRFLLYQTVRALLLNVIEHAGVGQARIVIEQTEKTLRVEVQDQGRGFDVAAALEQDRAPAGDGDSPESGEGLHSLGDRLRLLKGQLEVVSSPGEGAIITIEIPLDGASET